MAKILNIVGARPNFMKIAPILREAKRHPDLQAMLIHTGQHYDANLSEVFFREFGMPAPDRFLGVGSMPREEQIEKIQSLFEPILDQEKPDLVLVVGDVTSTIACARPAKSRGIRIAHVEAGLRSFDRSMPEEINRVETDQISDLLFVTEQSGLDNLKRERVPGAVHFVGNVMIDTLVANVEQAKESVLAAQLGLVEQEFVVSTFHRPSNVDSVESLQRLFETIRIIVSKFPVVLPLHPRTRHSLEANGLWTEFSALPGLVLTEPLGYLDFLGLVVRSAGVVTDSGGIQEESTFLGVPCLTMRLNTERPVTIDVGTNTLIGTDLARLASELGRIRSGEYKHGTVPPLWDGRAAERIIEILRREWR